MVLIIKKLVSKKKKRITEKVNKTTFDLDLSCKYFNFFFQYKFEISLFFMFQMKELEIYIYLTNFSFCDIFKHGNLFHF